MSTPALAPTTGTPDGGVLIVGASQAGVQLASSLRTFGWAHPITLIGAETHLPYHRPPLSKKALLDGIVPDDLALRSEHFFADNDINLILGERITHLQLENGAGVVTTDTGRNIAFARLALTVGARPRRLELPGADLAGIHYLRNNDDAAALRQALTATPRVVVIGGGFIGLEVSATARKLGCEVTVILADDRLMARAVSPHVSSYFMAAHQKYGVDIRCQTLPVAYSSDGGARVTGVELADGQVLAADVVVVGVGAVPRTELAEQAGLTVDGGIIVDEHALTSDGVTVAAGDCTLWPGTRGSAAGTRFESVNAATEQAKVAAATLAGTPEPWVSTPWFWSDQFDLKLQVAGMVPKDGITVHRHDPTHSGTTILHYAGAQLVAAECINRPADFMAAKSALNKGRSIDPARAADTDVPLKTLFVDANAAADDRSQEAIR